MASIRVGRNSSGPSLGTVDPSTAQLPKSVGNASSLVLPVGAPTGDSTGAGDLAQIVAQVTAASNAGGGTVRLRAGQTYTINTPNSQTYGTPSGGTTTLSYAIALPSNVTLDLNGATLLAASGATGILVTNAHPTSGGGDVSVGLVSSSAIGIVDGNGQIPAVGARGLVEFAWTTSPKAYNVRAQNGYTVGFFFYGNTNGDYDELSTNSIKGGGISMGQPFTNAWETNPTIGRVLTQNCTPEPGNTFFNPGNGVYLVASGGTTVSITGINNTGGDKLDRPSIDHQITAVFGINNGDSGGNSGFKFQGGTSSSTTTSSSPIRCEVGLVHMINQNGAGLYMDGCIDCTVTKYVGRNNGIAGSYPDVWMGGVRDTVGDLLSDGAWQDGLLIRGYAVDPRVRTARIRNPNRSNTANLCGINQAGANLTISQIQCIDELDFPTNVVATAVAGGGSFAGGVQQFYMVTYTNANGETTGSYEVNATPAASGSVVLTWGTGSLPSGVTGVKVYRATSTLGEFTSPALVATLGTVTTYTDTGSATSAGSVPTTNTAATKLMRFGVGQSTSRATLKVDSLVVRGALTAPVNAVGTITQSMISGGQMLESGRFIRPITTNVTTAQLAQGVLTAMPIVIGEQGTILTLNQNVVTTPGQAGALIRMGIYNDDGHGQPNSLLIDAGTVAADTTGTKQITINLPIQPGKYHLAYVAQNCATTAPNVEISTGTVIPPIPLNSAANAWLTNQNCFSQTGITGALPASWGSVSQGASGAVVAIGS